MSAATLVREGVDAQLREVAEMVGVDPLGRPTVAGQPLACPLERMRDELARVLYARWYVAWSPPPPPSGVVGAAELDLVAALRAAHIGSERHVGGWRARRVSTRGRVEAARGDETRLLDRSDYMVPGRPGLRAEPGDELLVTARDDYVAEGDFWVTHLEGFDEQDPKCLLSRVYWRLPPAAMPALVRMLTKAITDLGTPAALKVLADWRAYGRADAAVLYVPRDAFATLGMALHGVAERLDSVLADASPRLTLRLARGVGTAEGRASEPSFGESRCTLIAEALLADLNRPQPARVAAIRAHFAKAGIDPDRPHLAPDGRDGSTR